MRIARFNSALNKLDYSRKFIYMRFAVGFYRRGGISDDDSCRQPHAYCLVLAPLQIVSPLFYMFLQCPQPRPNFFRARVAGGGENREAVVGKLPGAGRVALRGGYAG